MGGGEGIAEQTPALSGLEPEAFWGHFAALTRIARPSRQEQAVSDHVRSWAEQHGFEVEGDSAGNLVVRVPASEGRESAPKITLQGHLDMVCERDPDSPNDPAEGRIELARDGDWLTANGTTLGADDGVAIAAMMALVEDESNLHGPLELLMTVAEEVGLEGANGLDPKLVTGTVLVNLDSEEDGKLTVGCAGSTDTWIHVEKPREPRAPDSVTLSVTASGGLGGHSGSNIALGRANAIKVLGRVLREAYGEAPFRLVSLNGGKSRNAIPRDAVAVVSVAGDRRKAFEDAVEGAVATVRDAFKTTDSGATAVVAEAEAAADAWSEEATGALVDVVALVPTGPLAMSQDFDDLVETSTSLGEASTDGDRLTSSQPVALVQRRRSPRADRRPRRGGPARRGRARNEAQLRRLAARPRFGGTRGSQDDIRAPVWGGADRDRGARRSRDRRDRRQGRRAGHDLVRAPDRGATFPRRACEYPDRGTLLEAPRRLRGRDVEPGEAMNRWLLVLLLVLGLGTILGVSAAVGNGDKTGETVSTSDWADDVCGSVGAWEGQLESLRDELGQSNYGARRNDGGAGDSVERTLVVSGAIDRAVQVTNDTLGEGLPRAGIPDVGQGEQAAQILQDWADKTESDLRAAQQSLDDDADTTSGAFGALGGAIGALQKAAVDGRAAFKQVSELDPELADALESSGNCQKLMEEQP